MLALFLLETCLLSLLSPCFPPHALALISLSLINMQLSLLVIRYSELMALFLFLLARAAPVYLPTAISVALRPLFPFLQVQYLQVSLLKPAPFYKPFAGLGSTNKSATSLLLSDSRFVLLSVFPFTSNSMADLAGTVFFLLFYQATMGLQTLYLHPLQSLVISLFLSLVSTLLFLDWRRTVSSKFFVTQVPSIFNKELVLPCHTRCVLSRPHCNGHSLLLSSYLFRIGRIKNSSCGACGHSS